LGLANLSTKRQRIADLARTKSGVALSTLHHVLDLEWMREAYRLTRKDGAPGIDGVTAAEYAQNLEANLSDLLERIKSGRYQAPPVRRVYIPKGDGAGSLRPLGLPTFEDKVAQRAIVMVLEAIYEQDFLPCSYGFRPGRSAHQALQELRTGFMSHGLRWVIDLDIENYFGSISHSHLRAFLDRRVTDGVIRRMIDKWLKAGVLEDGLLRHATEGSPQGGVISPCLSNIFLHHVLDEWFENEVKSRLKGRSTLVRYADDAVMAFSDSRDAKRVLDVLGKRLARYELTLHPDKTRFVDFRSHRPDDKDHPDTDGSSFTFLGFCHVWGKSRKGNRTVWQVTAKKRYARALAAVTDWCRTNRHKSIRDQHAHLVLKMRGHYAYYGISGNLRRLRRYAYEVARIWHKWLRRRDRRRRLIWDRFRALLERHPLPTARIVHRNTAVSEALP
jgi:RNA-directed DNA polymerase